MSLLLYALARGPPSEREGFAEARRHLPWNYRVLNASVSRSVKRSLRFTIGNTRSIGLNHGAYGGTRSKPIPIESAKSRTEEE